MARCLSILGLAGISAALLLLLVTGRPAEAHFLLNTNIRIIHVERLDDGVRLDIRLPAPIVLGRLLTEQELSGEVIPELPYVTSEMEGPTLVHYLDREAIERDPDGLGRMIAEGHVIEVDGERLQGEVQALRIHPGQTQPRFVELPEVRAAFDGPLYPEDAPPIYVGDAVLDAAIFYPTPDADGEIQLWSRLAKGLPGEETLANLVLDYIKGERRIYRITGTFAEPLVLNRSPWTAALSFVRLGVRHILDGYDHILFVLCLTVGATSLGNLLWRITGFTLGHCVTLIAGFFGYAPQGAWFIPAVETAIALSIIYAGMVALLARKEGATFVITALIGLLHGFGFSFVLRSMLDLDAPHVWVSLLSFNLGVELGQVAIVAVVWLAFLAIARLSPPASLYGRKAVALVAIAIALLWTGERVTGLVQMAMAQG